MGQSICFNGIGPGERDAADKIVEPFVLWRDCLENLREDKEVYSISTSRCCFNQNQASKT